MKQRSITDEEIALIKAMSDGGMINKNIQFFFNRPGRAVNSGRISGIISGQYSNSKSIPPASKADLEAFIKSNPTTDGHVPLVSVVANESPQNPIDPGGILDLFGEDDAGCWRLKVGESDKHECKENFGFKHPGKWLRAVAALANNGGGYILFGVRDKKVVNGKITEDSYKVVGLANSEFENADPADFTQKIKSTFDPTPRVENKVIEVGGIKVGVFYVHQHPSRPVIATKQDEAINEGDIFYRYPGQSTRIKYGDLRTMLDERDKAAREQLIPLVAKLVALGAENAMIADLTSGSLSDGKKSIIIEESLLDRIKFIREGEFDEIKGDATLRLVGDVTAMGKEVSTIHRAFVTPADLVADFLSLQSPSDPLEYIRCAVEGGNGAWLPMHYYAKMAGLTKDSLADFIAKTAARPKRRKAYVDRAIGLTTALQPSGGQPKAFAESLKAGKVPEVKTLQDATFLCRALVSMDGTGALSLSTALSILKQCMDLVQEHDDQAAVSVVRRAIARTDELFFGV